MSRSEARNSERRGVRFVPTSGSTIGGIWKEKTARITDAMADLQLGMDGLRSRWSGARGDRGTPPSGGNQRAHALGSFARTCSLFLRKTVLGDRGARETRLLDDRVLAATGLRFDRLRRIRRDSRRVIEAGFGLAGGVMELTRLDDHTREPQETYRLFAGPQEL